MRVQFLWQGDQADGQAHTAKGGEMYVIRGLLPQAMEHTRMLGHSAAIPRALGQTMCEVVVT